MARGKTFDPDAKIDEAVDLFRRRGCDAVSIQDIVGAPGLNRGSLYATCGDKEQLWLRALGRYCELRNARLAELTAGPEAPALPRIRARMTSLTQLADGLPRGCLIVNAITGRTADSATRDLALRQVGHVGETLRQALEGVRDAARSRPRRRPGSWRFLVVMLQGLHVCDRAVTDPCAVHDAVKVAVSAIRLPGPMGQPEQAQAAAGPQTPGPKRAASRYTRPDHARQGRSAA
jgi:TetR/AcrR family transcriptional regulator, transcriptional repressor for nem operon